MLLKAGMSVKQAIFYNLVSSVLSYAGMVAGLLLGQISHVTPWIFAATAGIFLYVALVDMVPELSSGHTGEAGQWVGVALQVAGGTQVTTAEIRTIGHHIHKSNVYGLLL